MSTSATTSTQLQLTDVHRSFGAVRALKGVSLDVRAGEVHALLGENGAGKSTLMAVAAGSLPADAGTVSIGGEVLDDPSPSAVRRLGLGVVYQHPALADDLTIVENMRLAVPDDVHAERDVEWARQRLSALGVELDPRQRVAELDAAERQLVEIAKALALDPRVLILDEPSAALDSEGVAHLSEQVRAIRDAGTAVVYISHRVPEVQQIADRLTVLRDGSTVGTFDIGDVTEEDILALIAGRSLDAMFPGKRPPGTAAPPLLEVERLTGAAFHDVSLTVERGEIVGVAGIAGNGQREFLRAIAGLETSTGRVAVAGREGDVASPRRAQASGIHFVPADRHREGVFIDLSVRENIAATALGSFGRSGLVRREREREAVTAEAARLRVKTETIESPVTTLSGGNQQKVAIARATMADPVVLVCDEPTQGVDVGARAEIYAMLRAIADQGQAIVVTSSDALELEGLCDRVLVMSRGQTVTVLEGAGLTEAAITGAAVTATHDRSLTQAASRSGRRTSGLRRLLRSENIASTVLAALLVVVTVLASSQNEAFFTSFNLQNLLVLATALMLVSLGQLVVVLTAGVDLSVGPTMGLALVVVTSFATAEAGGAGLAVGVGLMLLAGVTVGLVNAALVEYARISPIIATLATFIAVQGVALLINPVPSGSFDRGVSRALAAPIAGIPAVFLVVAVLGVLAEVALRQSRFGRSLRAIGSDESAAHRIGVPVRRVRLAAYVLCSTFAALAGLMLAAQIGIGDATAGQNYTLQSLAAIVLGGASVYGGRGSVIGALLGGLLLTELVGAIAFLSLGRAWQFWLPGLIILVAAGLYSRFESEDEQEIEP